MATPNIVPRADSEGGLGTASKYWASAYIDLIYVGAGKVGRDADNLIDFSVDNNIVFKVNGASELQLNADEFFPYTSNGLSLGNSSRMWSDLFLADGAVINFDNGEVTMTHSGSGDFTIDVADDIRFDAGGGDIVLRAGGTEYGRLSNSSGDFVIKNITADKDIIFQADDGSGGTTTYFQLDGSSNIMIGYKSLYMLDDKRVYLGTAGDLELYHDSTNSIIRNQNGNLTIENTHDSGDIIFRSDNGSGGTTAYITLDGSAGHTTVQKHLQTADSVEYRVGTGGDARFMHDGSNTYLNNFTGNLTIQQQTDSGDIIFRSDDGAGGEATYFLLDGSSAEHDGSATTELYTNWPDNSYISLGTGHDLKMYHNGSNSYIDQTGTGDLYIRNLNENRDIIFQSDDGTGGGNVETYFFLDGSASSGPFTTFLDSSKLAFGIGRDLQIYHDGSNSYIDETGDGGLYLKSSAIRLQSAGGENMIYGVADSAVYIYHNNAKKFETTSTGIAVTGGATFSSDLDIGGGGAANVRLTTRGATDDANAFAFEAANSSGASMFFVRNDAAVSVIGTFTVGADDTGHDVIFYGDTSGEYLQWDASQDRLEFRDNVGATFGNDGDFNIVHNGSHTFLKQFASKTGNIYIQQATADSDIILQADDGSGGTTAYITLDGSETNIKVEKNLYATDGVLLSVGNSLDLRLKHDGTDSFIFNETGDLYIQNKADGKDIIFQSDDGSGGTETYFFLDGSAGGSEPATVFPDNSYVHFGSGFDLNIGHSGSASSITNNTGNLTISNNTDDGDIIFKASTGSASAAAYLTLDGSETKINVSCTNGMQFDDNVRIKVGSGSGGDLRVYHDGSNSFIQDSGAGDLRLLSSHLKLMDTSENLVFGVQAGGVAVTGDVSITSTAASAVGAGFDGAETVAIQIGEVNQEIITTIQIDLGTGGATDIVSSGTAGDVIGENDTAAAFITKYDSTKSGVLYKAELICLETPAGGDTDINLVLNATSLAEDAASEAEGHVIIDGGAQTIGMRTESTASVITAAAGAHNDYIYLAHGGTTAGTYSAGKFLIRLYGAKATL